MTSLKLEVPERIIGPGEYYASREDMVISTLLGSCISVALYVPGTGMGVITSYSIHYTKLYECAALCIPFW